MNFSSIFDYFDYSWEALEIKTEISDNPLIASTQKCHRTLFASSSSWKSKSAPIECKRKYCNSMFDIIL